MSEARLSQKGMRGALVLLDGHFDTAYQGQLPCTRHLHPFEIAITHGVVPPSKWGDSLRLCLAGLGQMASPVQACWITSLYLNQLEDKFGLPTVLPELRLGKHFQRVFSAMAEQQPGLVNHPSVANYVDRIWKSLEVSIHATQPRAHVHLPTVDQDKQPPSEAEELEKNEKHPPSEAAELEKKVNQPPARAGEPEKNFKQPAVPVSPVCT